MVRAFIDAVEDSNPLWLDEGHAKKGPYGALVAPPEFLCSAMMSGSGVLPDVPMPSKTGLEGADEWEFYEPIKIGDTITAVGEFVDIYTRNGKSGKMAFMIFDSTHTNQNGKLVAKSRITLIYRSIV
jgi:acyl dehydratase